MKRLFFTVAVALATSTVFSQDNLIVDRYMLLESQPKKKTELDTLRVPEKEVWRIESALCQLETEYVSLVIGENAVLIALFDAGEQVSPQLPFYLPGGTEFRLGSRQDPGLVSICVLRIE